MNTTPHTSSEKAFEEGYKKGYEDGRRSVLEEIKNSFYIEELVTSPFNIPFKEDKE